MVFYVRASYHSSLLSEGPSFGSTKTYHEFLEGSSGVVPCLVTGQPAVDVRWLRDKQELSSRGTSRIQSLGLDLINADLKYQKRKNALNATQTWKYASGHC